MWGAPGWNQWPLQQSMFNNVPHDQIDWAALAKQWIQMQKPGAEEDGGSGPVGPPQPPPVLPMEDFSRDDLTHVPLNVEHPFPPPGGCSEPRNPPLLPDPIPNFGPRNVNEPYWHSEWEGNVPPDMDGRGWIPPPPQHPPQIPPVMIPSEKKTFDYGHIHDNPAMTMQTVDYNHGPDHYYNQMYVPPPPPQEDPYEQYWSQVGSAPMMQPPSFLKKDRVTEFPNEDDASHIDAAKRKQLPAWIREGLEKMEQERIKRLEKEKFEKERSERAKKNVDSLKKGLLGTEEPLLPSKSKFDSDSDNEEESPVKPIIKKQLEIEHKRHISPPQEEVLTEEEKQQQLMLNVRRFLTEILLSVTNSEMAAIAKEVHFKALSKAPARPLASTSALRSIATGLNSLASYDSHSDKSESEAEESESSTSDEELHKRIQEKRKRFANKERKILAELEIGAKERRRSQSTESHDTDYSRSRRSVSQTKSENESDVKHDLVERTTISLISDQTVSSNNHIKDNYHEKLESPKLTSENGSFKKSKVSSSSNDSESDSSSSSSSSTDNRSRRKKSSSKRSSTKHKSPKGRHDKRKSSYHDRSEESRRSSSNKLKKHQSRTKKRSKNSRGSDSSQSSNSSHHHNSERLRRRSGSYERHSRKRSRSTSRHSRSRSRSRKDSQRHKRYHDESKKSKKESRRSPSYSPRHSRRKSRSTSPDRSQRYKKSKIR